MAYSLSQPLKGLVFHSDRSSQYTSQSYRELLKYYGVRASMGDTGACWGLLGLAGASWGLLGEPAPRSTFGTMLWWGISSAV